MSVRVGLSRNELADIGSVVRFSPMAVWQFVFDLIPSSAATIHGVVAARMNRDQLDAIELSFSGPTAAAMFKRLGAILPEKQAWAANLRILGKGKPTISRLLSLK